MSKNMVIWEDWVRIFLPAELALLLFLCAAGMPVQIALGFMVLSLGICTLVLRWRAVALAAELAKLHQADAPGAELKEIHQAYDRMGIVGIEDFFTGPADALIQMAGYIKELEEQLRTSNQQKDNGAPYVR